MNQTCPAESRTVNPGITPSFLAEITVQPPGAGPVPDPGPLTSSSTVTGTVPSRFVNHVESGTSSIVLRFCARTFGVWSPGQENRFSSVSYSRSISRSCTADASSASTIRVIGSSG